MSQQNIHRTQNKQINKHKQHIKITNKQKTHGYSFLASASAGAEPSVVAVSVMLAENFIKKEEGKMI